MSGGVDVDTEVCGGVGAVPGSGIVAASILLVFACVACSGQRVVLKLAGGAHYGRGRGFGKGAVE